MELWLAKAREDLVAADALLKAVMRAYDTVAFHAQQSVEKSLKAFLIRHQVKFGKTHNIAELLQLAEGLASGIRQELAAATTLTPFAVDARYPGEPPLDREEAARHLATARKALDHVASLLQPYLDAGRPGR